ncbi:MAG: hypothetical protein IPG74_06465 [Flavobacteriales bacterium]|nr:hypothetical protein [Flavobacteriales bacterium]
MAARYVRVQATAAGGTADIDAFVFAFGTQAGGTWTGPGVTGTQFDPSLQNGSVSITYTFGTGACGDVTIKNVGIDEAPVAGTITGGGTFCPGSSVTLTLAGYVGDVNGGPLARTGPHGRPFSLVPRTLLRWPTSAGHNMCRPP